MNESYASQYPRHIRQGISLAILIFTVAGIVFYLNNNRALLSVFTQVKLIDIAVLILLRLVFMMTNGLLLQRLLMRFGIKLTFSEWFGLPFVTTMGNHLTPLSGGMLARASYLKVRYEFPFRQFVTLLAASYLINFAVTGFTALILALCVTQTHFKAWLIVAMSIVLIVAVVVVLFAPPFKLPTSSRVFQHLNQALHGWRMIKADKVLLLSVSIVSALSMLLNGIAFVFAYSILGFSVSFIVGLLVSLSSVFSMLLTFTPGNIGIREGVISFMSELSGAGVGAGLLVALLIRGSTLFLAFTLGPIFSYRLLHRLRR